MIYFIAGAARRFTGDCQRHRQERPDAEGHAPHDERNRKGLPAHFASQLNSYIADALPFCRRKTI